MSYTTYSFWKKIAFSFAPKLRQWMNVVQRTFFLQNMFLSTFYVLCKPQSWVGSFLKVHSYLHAFGILRDFFYKFLNVFARMFNKQMLLQKQLQPIVTPPVSTGDFYALRLAKVVYFEIHLLIFARLYTIPRFKNILL